MNQQSHRFQGYSRSVVYTPPSDAGPLKSPLMLWITLITGFQSITQGQVVQLSFLHKEQHLYNYIRLQSIDFIT